MSKTSILCLNRWLGHILHLSPSSQFSGGDEANSFPVAGAEVDIVTSEGDHDLGSSKLKIKNIVNFGWDHKYSHGQVGES